MPRQARCRVPGPGVGVSGGGSACDTVTSSDAGRAYRAPRRWEHMPVCYAVHIEEGDDCTPSAIGVPVWAPICAAPWRANRVWSIMESLRVGIRVPDVEQARTFYCGLVFRKSGLSQAPTVPRS